MKRRKKKKKSLERITIHEEQIHQLLLNIDNTDSPHSPSTLQLNGEEDFSFFFSKYQHVILIPTHPNLGIENLEVLLDSSDIYMVKSPNKILWFSKKHEMLSYLKKHIQFECYKIQQYIFWATIENQLFDLKVILHRKKGNFTWKVTERYVEAHNKIRTVDQALKSSNLKGIDIEQLLRNVDNIALKIAQSKDDFFLQHRSVGIDIRLDYNGEIWITQICSNPVKMKGNKKSMYNFLKTDHYLSLFIPETKEIEDENALFSFLNQYRDVVLKPITGSLGKGIMRVVIDENSRYKVQYTNKNFEFIDKNQLLIFLKRKIKSKLYIIQQYLQLAKVKNSPLDFRVMVQKKSNDDNWKVTGIYAKVAFDGYFTTNLAKKGEVMTVEQAIGDSDLKETNLKELLQQIDDATLRVAQRLQEVAPYHRVWGLDMGIDSDGALWIIEVNSKPGLKGFKRLEDPSMYQTIQDYKK
ncbi:YheC/YheD family protein [Bacillus mycoides]|uniref:YheC/YheD family protein n=1 Tax=Bacillus mycoides TaxID=1405 RepID=UPI002E205140|nr:YheC/YheD family protein [Bacillus mycoides]